MNSLDSFFLLNSLAARVQDHAFEIHNSNRLFLQDFILVIASRIIRHKRDHLIQLLVHLRNTKPRNALI